MAAPPTAAIRQRTSVIRRAIDELDYLCAGTLLERTKLCGHAGCCCGTDPKARHGPYFEWSRRQEGRLVHSVVSPEQAKLLTRAIANYRRLQHLIGRWQSKTALEILGPSRSKRGNRR